MKNFPLQLKELRQLSGIHQKTIAEALNISLRSYQRYEEGSREPNINMLVMLAKYFSVSVDYLLGLTDNKETNK